MPRGCGSTAHRWGQQGSGLSLKHARKVGLPWEGPAGQVCGLRVCTLCLLPTFFVHVHTHTHTHTHTHSSVFSGWGLLLMDPLTLATVSSCCQLCWTRVYLLAEVASGLETISSGCLKELVYLARRQRGIWGQEWCVRWPTVTCQWM